MIKSPLRTLRMENIRRIKNIRMSLLLFVLLVLLTACGGNIDSNLLAAAGKGDTEKVKTLLSEGADVKTKDSDGKTALMIASEKGHSETVKVLDEKIVLSLLAAATEGKGEEVKELLEAGADVNAKDIWGNTALMGATKEGHEDIVQLLLDRGADVNSIAGENETALWIAAAYGHPQIARILLGHGAEVNARTRGGSTALAVAQENDFTEIVALLRDAGALGENEFFANLFGELIGAINDKDYNKVDEFIHPEYGFYYVYRQAGLYNDYENYKAFANIIGGPGIFEEFLAILASLWDNYQLVFEDLAHVDFNACGFDKPGFFVDSNDYELKLLTDIYRTRQSLRDEEVDAQVLDELGEFEGNVRRRVIVGIDLGGGLVDAEIFYFSFIDNDWFLSILNFDECGA